MRRRIELGKTISARDYRTQLLGAADQ